MNLGLVDGLGSSGYVARELIGAETIVDYTKKKDLLEGLAERRWYGPTGDVAVALQAARSVQTVADPHLAAQLPTLARCHAAPQLFGSVDRPCTSFSQWWTRVTRGITSLQQLPGLMGLSGPTGMGAHEWPGAPADKPVMTRFS